MTVRQPVRCSASCRASVAWISTSPRLHFDYMEMDFNPGFYESMTAELDRFWNENVLGGVAPEDQNADDTLLRYPRSEDGKTATADEEVYDAWKHLHRIKDELTDLETQKDILEAVRLAEEEFKKIISA